MGALFSQLSGCSSTQSNRALTTTQYFMPLTIGIITLKSFGSNE